LGSESSKIPRRAARSISGRRRVVGSDLVDQHPPGAICDSQILALRAGERVELSVQATLAQGQLPRLGMDVESAALSACLRRRLSFEDNGADTVHVEHPRQVETAEARADDREARCPVDIGWRSVYGCHPPSSDAVLGQAKLFERQACTLEIGQFHLRILS
jgi:hypothetical protein